MGVNFSGHESEKLQACKAAFQQWHVDEVAAKWRTVADKKRAGTLESNTITRAGYFDVFAGLSVDPGKQLASSQELAACKFLSLPMWMFNAFDISNFRFSNVSSKRQPYRSDGEAPSAGIEAGIGYDGAEGARGSYYEPAVEDLRGREPPRTDREPAAKVGKVDMMHLFTGLCMFCRGSLLVRTRVCFQLFDDDFNGTMDKAEMRVFLTSATRTLHVLDLMPVLPKPSEVRELADTMFAQADSDGDGCLSPDEFYQWARKHMRTRSLMKRFRKAAETIVATIPSSKRQFVNWTDMELGARHVYGWGATPKHVLSRQEAAGRLGGKGRAELAGAVFAARDAVESAHKDLGPIAKRLRCDCRCGPCTWQVGGGRAI